MRWFFLILAIAVVATVYALGPRGDKFSDPPFELFPDMDHQERVNYQKPSDFFDDGQASRQPIEGTVPLGFVMPHEGNEGDLSTNLDFSRGDSYFDTGMYGDFFGEGYPKSLEIDSEFLARGKRRYQITCTPCHGTSGNGVGVVSKYWAIPPSANLIDARVSAMPEGQIFWTITHGKGLMGPYNGVLSVHDRWAVVAYVKSLQAAAGN